MSQSRSSTSFWAAVGPGSHFEVLCAILPSAWEICPEGVEFAATVRGGSDKEAWVRSQVRVLDPSRSWNDRGWRRLVIHLPPAATGEVVIRLDTRPLAAGASRDIPVAWGDPALVWPRTRNERRRLVTGAVRRARWSGLRGAVQYAVGHRRAHDEAAIYERWVQAHALDARALGELRAQVSGLAYQPIVSIITPVCNTPPDILSACIESVRAQAYGNWQLCMADDGSSAGGTAEVLARCSGDPRIRVTKLDVRSGISAASNAALALATGDYVAFLDHDDTLAPEALADVVRYLNDHRDADVVYSDEDKLDTAGRRCEPYFKPDWSPELFLSYMYACHFLVVRRELVQAAGGFRREYDGAQDYDLLLRVMERTRRIHHIPRVLYHWRKGAGSAAQSNAGKPWAVDAGRRALEDYAARSGAKSQVLSGPAPGMYRFRRAIRGEPLVSLVIPTTGRPRGRDDLLARCLRSLSKTTWSNFEVVLSADGGELSPPARGALTGLRHTVVRYAAAGPFNFARKVNHGVRHASGEHIVLFNDDLEVVTPEWLTAMLEYSQEPEIGAVGAKLLYPDGRIQHVGMLVGVCGLAAHAFHQAPGRSAGYFGSAVVPRNCSAVTAACLMTRRALFDQLGGLDESLPVDFNDVDFCLRLRSAGFRIVFTPYAELVHHESTSIGRRQQSARELALVRERWGRTLEQDPYYNPNLSRLFSDYRLQL
jgi:GT2 family glycosyltransferase